jgi:FkbH-like protein
MFRWALLSNTTISPLVRRLRSEVPAAETGCEFFCAEYGDALRQVFAEDSELLAFGPHLVVLHLDLEHIKPHLELSFAFETAARREEIFREVVEHIVEAATTLRSKTGATLLVSSFPTPPRSVLGIGVDHLFKTAVRRANLEIDSRLRCIPCCHVVDCDSLWAEAGWSDRDRRFEAIAQLPMGPRMQKLLAAEWVRYFRAIQGLTRKCIVVDLDNTLWHGILGEDGPAGLQMGDTPQGRGFRQFQLSLKALSRRGTILAISSKNNLEDAIDVIRNHPDMVLREQDFAAMEINWDDKATNISRILATLNIGAGHLVFLDDSPSERNWVRQSHPEVLVPEMPADGSGFSDVLSQCGLDTLMPTTEDLRRTEMYREERERRAFQVLTPSYDRFLKELDIHTKIQKLNPALLDRAVQLCQRTNQFNLTTRRHTAEQIQAFSQSSAGIVLMMTLHDRFGEYGWSGLAIATAQSERVTIDSFLLSCRVLGKNVELALFSALVRWAATQNCTAISGLFEPTLKNKPCADFYGKCGLVPRDAAPERTGQWFDAKIAELPHLPIEHLTMSIDFQGG